MQPVQCVLLFLVLAGNSALLRFLRSYTVTLVTRSYALLRRTKTSHRQSLIEMLYSALYVKCTHVISYETDAMKTLMTVALFP